MIRVAKQQVLIAAAMLCCPIPAAHADASFESMMASTIRIYCIGADGIHGSGSGFVVGQRDHVVTNWHVVECSKDGGKIRLLLNSVPRETIDAEVARYDEHKDLAVLKLAVAIDKPAVTFTSVRSVAVRDPITAVGFPGGADRDERVLHIPILDDGQVTKIYPPPPPGTEQAVQLVMHKATINPGNSGGPLFDLYGRVVGANTQKDLVVVATIGEDGQPQLERVVRGDNLGWAVVSDALFPLLDALQIPYSVDNSRPSALRNLWHREPLLTAILGIMLLCMLTLAALVTNQRGRAAVRDGVTRAYTRLRKGPDPEPKIARPMLRGIKGPYQGQVIPLDDGPVAIGRDPAMSKLVLPPDRDLISKRHAVVRYDRERAVFLLEDCWSTNGTFLSGGTALDAGQEQVIEPGQGFYLGDPAIAFEVVTE